MENLVSKLFTVPAAAFVYVLWNLPCPVLVLLVVLVVSVVSVMLVLVVLVVSVMLVMLVLVVMVSVLSLPCRSARELPCLLVVVSSSVRLSADKSISYFFLYH